MVRKGKGGLATTYQTGKMVPEPKKSWLSGAAIFASSLHTSTNFGTGQKLQCERLISGEFLQNPGTSLNQH